MIDPAQIPPEAAIAAIAAIDDEPFSSGPSDDLRTMRAAIAAALNAWQGMEYWPEFSDAGLGEHEPGKVFLPLTEARDG
jgi:hypothetical protein